MISRQLALRCRQADGSEKKLDPVLIILFSNLLTRVPLIVGPVKLILESGKVIRIPSFAIPTQPGESQDN